MFQGRLETLKLCHLGSSIEHVQLTRGVSLADGIRYAESA